MSPRSPGAGGADRRTRGRPRRATAAFLALGTLTGGVALASPAAAAELPYPTTDKGSLYNIAQVVGAHDSYRAGWTGAGVGVAVIDTGVAAVPGLTSGNVVTGPDFSFDSQDPELAGRDVYGHGTHMASIIAGRDQAGPPASYTDPGRFTGIAPDATLISLKVGASDGSVDVTQVIAALDWAVAHRADYNIRVINLSYGTDSTQAAEVDPLVFAAENAWRNGIVVVVAGGNDGVTTRRLANPAQSENLIAVGADDTQGTVDPNDDVVPTWATLGTDKRHVDLVAPAVSVLGLRVPGGFADMQNPNARVGDRFARATGTSQAAAVVSGEAALLLQRYPTMTPNQVKEQLEKTAEHIKGVSDRYRGSGLTNVFEAQSKKPNGRDAKLKHASTGTGSIEGSRGSSHVAHDGAPLQGEFDIFGNTWDSASWAAASAAGTVWSGGTWRGAALTSSSATGTSWQPVEWTRPAWDARMWRSDDWESHQWRNGSWTGNSWSARMWRDQDWSARMWRSADLAQASWG